MGRAVAFVAALACSVALAAHPARAETVTLTPVEQPSLYHPTGRAIDVSGISPGMTPAAVHAVLTKAYGEVTVIEDTLGVSDNGAEVTTQKYVARMAARRDADEVLVWFGTPTTGNAVVEVTHQITYPATTQGPALSDLREELVHKYGAPAFDAPALASGEVKLLAWSYKGDTPVACTALSCRADLTDGLSFADLANYRRAVKRGHDLTIVGMLLTAVTDPARTASLVVTVSDTATKLRTLDTAMAQIRTALHPTKASAKPPR